MDFNAANDGLKTLFAELLGIPCDWRRQPQQVHTSAAATIDVISAPGELQDESVLRPVRDGAGDVVSATETVYGNRELTLQLSVWSPSQMLGASALHYIERFRTRLVLAENLERLKALGFSLIERLPIVNLDDQRGRQAGRVFSARAMDLRLGYGHAESAPVAIIKQTTARVTVDGRAAPPVLFPPE